MINDDRARVAIRPEADFKSAIESVVDLLGSRSDNPSAAALRRTLPLQALGDGDLHEILGVFEGKGLDFRLAALAIKNAESLNIYWNKLPLTWDAEILEFCESHPTGSQICIQFRFCEPRQMDTRLKEMLKLSYLIQDWDGWTVTPQGRDYVKRLKGRGFQRNLFEEAEMKAAGVR